MSLDGSTKSLNSKVAFVILSTAAIIANAEILDQSPQMLIFPVSISKLFFKPSEVTTGMYSHQLYKSFNAVHINGCFMALYKMMKGSRIFG